MAEERAPTPCGVGALVFLKIGLQFLRKVDAGAFSEYEVAMVRECHHQQPREVRHVVLPLTKACSPHQYPRWI